MESKGSKVLNLLDAAADAIKKVTPHIRGLIKDDIPKQKPKTKKKKEPDSITGSQATS